MKAPAWWRQKSRQAKTITALAVLLILQIGLCFSTQPLTHRLPFIPKSYDDPMESLGLMFWQAAFCLLTVGMIVIASVFWLPEMKAGKKQEKENND